ncbi:hypothetical protein EVAR_61960_1 [Eumeta japonica]|uniref:Uncharacterized protein n=1 Tax=Eumeta variegata TaxID=151549 RepID=A0A4C1ZKE6_EUMVA|nr:hypothetical protein EVAR_61960_1 [Eumeta japonica]
MDRNQRAARPTEREKCQFMNNIKVYRGDAKRKLTSGSSTTHLSLPPASQRKRKIHWMLRRVEERRTPKARRQDAARHGAAFTENKRGERRGRGAAGGGAAPRKLFAVLSKLLGALIMTALNGTAAHTPPERIPRRRSGMGSS